MYNTYIYSCLFHSTSKRINSTICKLFAAKYSTEFTTTNGLSPTTSQKSDGDSNTTTIVVVVLVVITLLIIIAAIVYTLYKKGYFSKKDGLHRMRSIVNPGYGQLDEMADSVSIKLQVSKWTSNIMPYIDY